MPVSDYLVRILSKNGKVRAVACTTTDLVNELRLVMTPGQRLLPPWKGSDRGSVVGSLLKTGQRVGLSLRATDH